jgi:hypothetical protein
MRLRDMRGSDNLQSSISNLSIPNLVNPIFFRNVARSDTLCATFFFGHRKEVP